MKNQITSISDPYKPRWVCTLCYPYMLEIGKVSPLGYLVYNKDTENCRYGQYGEGIYAILLGQGHGDDESMYFDVKPCFQTSENGWKYDHRNMSMPVYLMGNVFKEIKEYDPKLYKSIMSSPLIINGGDHRILDFLMSRLNRLVTNWERKYGNIEDFYHNKFFPEKQKQKEES